MPRRRRSELKRHRREEKRAAALARLPQMLADEEALRAGVKSLNARARRIPQHLDYDRKIGELRAQLEPTVTGLKEGLTALTNELGEIVLGDKGSCEKALAQLHRLEQLNLQADLLAAELAEACVARAELGVVPVDREELASKIDQMGERLSVIRNGIERNRAYVVSLCSEHAQ